MEIRDYLLAWRRRWMIIAVAVLLGVCGAVAVSAVTKPEYRANASLFVNTNGTSVTEAYQGQLFSKDRVASYADLATGREVAQRAIDSLGVKMTADELRSHITAKPMTDSVLLQISVTNPNPRLAQDLTNAVAAQTAQVVQKLETSPQGGSPAASAILVDAAETPSSPASPSWSRNVALGIIAGLVIGLIAALVRDKSDHTVRDVNDSADALPSVQPLGSVPRVEHVRGSPAFGGPGSYTEQVRELRTNLLVNGRHGANPAIVVASPRRYQGVSPLVINLAAALAETGRTILIIDADLTSGSVTDQLGLRPRDGLAELLTGQAGLDDVLTSSRIPGVTLISSGQGDGTGREMLGSITMADIVKQLRAQYSYVLIAGSPMLETSDTAVVAATADGVVIVAQYGVTTRADLQVADHKLNTAGSAAVGIVIDDLHSSRFTF